MPMKKLSAESGAFRVSAGVIEARLMGKGMKRVLSGKKGR